MKKIFLVGINNTTRKFVIRIVTMNPKLSINNNKVIIPDNLKDEFISLKIILDEAAVGPLWFRFIMRLLNGLANQDHDSPFIINSEFITFEAKILFDDSSKVFIDLTEDINGGFYLSVKNVKSYEIDNLIFLDNPKPSEVKKWKYLVYLLVFGIVTICLVFLMLYFWI